MGSYKRYHFLEIIHILGVDPDGCHPCSLSHVYNSLAYNCLVGILEELSEYSTHHQNSEAALLTLVNVMYVAADTWPDL